MSLPSALSGGRPGRAASVLSAVGFLGLGTLAPFQCGHERDPSLRREESPGEALWALAEELDRGGDVCGAATTYRFLAARYPSSRFAATARERSATAPPHCGDGGP